MTKPFQIIEAKISLATTRALSELRTDAEAIHRRAAKNGMGGGTIIELKDECLFTLKALGELVTKELSWALSQTYFVNPTTIDTCNALARRSLDFACDECAAILRKTINLCGNERHYSLTAPELRSQEQHSLMDISLALDSIYSELKLKRLRSSLGFLQEVFKRILSFFLGRG